MRRIYNIKKTISMKQFIAELGEEFSELTKKRLLELGKRCVLTRKEDNYTLDLKHIEHTQYECASDLAEDLVNVKKEYAYGQFIVNEGKLYFSNKCVENQGVMQSPVVNTIYDTLDSKDMIENEENSAKIVNDSNIEYVVDSILSVCPPVSEAHLQLVKEMTYRSNL